MGPEAIVWVHEMTIVATFSGLKRLRLILGPVLWLWLLTLQPAASQPEPYTSAIAAILSGHPSDTALSRFYLLRQNRPAWFDANGPNGDGKLAAAAIAAADLDGLSPARYQLDMALRPSTGSDVSDLAQRDILLTTKFLRYVSDLHSGREELKHLDRDVELPSDRFDAAAGLSRALTEGKLAEYLRAIPPQGTQYAGLRSALAYYRAIAAKGGWTEIPSAASLDSHSTDDKIVQLLAARLAQEDAKLANTTSPSATDIDAGIRRFQERHGLTADGVVGESTRAALNVSPTERAAQIAANMERLRWMPRGPEKTYVQVNVADASLAVIDNGSTILSSRIIVGRPKTPTPIFRAEIDDVVVNPPWNVPDSIARHEIVPRLKKNPSYLEAHGMRIVNGRIQQRPGAKNALGYVKLNVSSRFLVYLHDTPSRSLFTRDRRFLSHGCIRVEEITPLASYALTGTTTGGLEQLAATINTGQTTHLPVNRPIPLYVEYFTAFLSPDGNLQFRPDIYGRDRRLIAAMSGSTTARNGGPGGNCLRAG